MAYSLTTNVFLSGFFNDILGIHLYKVPPCTLSPFVMELANCQSTVLWGVEQYVYDVRQFGLYEYKGPLTSGVEFLRCWFFLEAHASVSLEAIIKGMSEFYGYSVNLNDVSAFLTFQDSYLLMYWDGKSDPEILYSDMIKTYRKIVGV